MTMQREVRLLNEWLWENHSDVVIHRNYPLGKHGEGSDYRMFMTKAPRCDAWFEKAGRIFIIEAKVVDELKGVAELELYRKLFAETPELEPLKNKPVSLILLRARERPEITGMCVDKGITPVLYCPDWCVEYLTQLVEQKRQR